MSHKTWEMPDGIYTALVTPFAGDQVDRKAWERLVQRQIDGGVAGIVPVGCTGEAATLTAAEREWLIRSAVEQCQGKCEEFVGRPFDYTYVIDYTNLITLMYIH